MITRQMTPFFHILFEPYQLVYFVFAFQGIQNSVPQGSRFALCCLLQNTRFHYKDDTLNPVNIGILFQQKVANFWYITCFVSNLILIWSQLQGICRTVGIVIFLPPPVYRYLTWMVQHLFRGFYYYLSAVFLFFFSTLTANWRSGSSCLTSFKSEQNSGRTTRAS